MKHTPKNIFYHELIGLYVKVVKHYDESLIGVEGRVVDETKNLLIIASKGRLKKVFKKGGVFLFMLPDGSKVEVEGEKILARPEDRVKLIRKRR